MVKIKKKHIALSLIGLNVAHTTKLLIFLGLTPFDEILMLSVINGMSLLDILLIIGFGLIIYENWNK